MSITVDDLVEAWRRNMKDASKDETAREHWLRKELAGAEARGYARAREQAQEAVGQCFRDLDAVFPRPCERRSGILDMHAAAAAALNAMQDEGEEKP